MKDEARPKVVIARRVRSVGFEWTPLRRALAVLLEDHGARGTLSVAVVGDPEIALLHERFLGVRGPTDVLAFPLGEGSGASSSEGVFGEVVVSAETAAREAARRGLRPERELALYAIHGALHLVGYDDRTEATRRRMRGAERKYLETWAGFSGERRGLGRACPLRRRARKDVRFRGRRRA
ncbi:MAG: rRNA maturation RNase YbeY [Planctomycetota bacterium]